MQEITELNGITTVLSLIKASLASQDLKVQLRATAFFDLLLHQERDISTQVNVMHLDQQVVEVLLSFPRDSSEYPDILAVAFSIMQALWKDKESRQRFCDETVDLTNILYRTLLQTLFSKVDTQQLKILNNTLNLIETILQISQEEETEYRTFAKNVSEMLHAVCQRNKEMRIPLCFLCHLHRIVRNETVLDQQCLMVIEQSIAQKLTVPTNDCCTIQETLETIAHSVTPLMVTEEYQQHAMACFKNHIFQCALAWFSALTFCSNTRCDAISPRILSTSILWGMNISDAPQSNQELKNTVQGFLSSIISNHLSTREAIPPEECNVSYECLTCVRAGLTTQQRRTLAALFVAVINGASLGPHTTTLINNLARRCLTTEFAQVHPSDVCFFTCLGVEREIIESTVFSACLFPSKVHDHWFDFCINTPPPALFLNTICFYGTTKGLFEESMRDWASCFSGDVVTKELIQWACQLTTASLVFVFDALSNELSQKGMSMKRQTLLRLMDILIKTSEETQRLPVQAVIERMPQWFQGQQDECTLLQILLQHSQELSTHACSYLTERLCKSGPLTHQKLTCLAQLLDATKRQHADVFHEVMEKVSGSIKPLFANPEPETNEFLNIATAALGVLCIGEDCGSQLPSVEQINDILSVSFKRANFSAAICCIQSMKMKLASVTCLSESLKQKIQLLLLHGLFTPDENCQMAAADTAVFLGDKISCTSNAWNVSFFDSFVSMVIARITPTKGWIVYMVSFFSETTRPLWLANVSLPAAFVEALLEMVRGAVAFGQTDESTVLLCVLLFYIRSCFPHCFNEETLQVLAMSVREVLSPASQRLLFPVHNHTDTTSTLTCVSSMETDFVVPTVPCYSRAYDPYSLLSFLQHALTTV